MNFKNTVIIMTSNIGSPNLLDGIDSKGVITAEAREAVTSELRRHFRPEFLNRVDDTVLFKPLTVGEIEQIVVLMTGQLVERLRERRITLELSEEARTFIAREGYDPVYGARPLQRFIQRHLETRIGRALVGGEILDGATIRVDLKGDDLTVTHENPVST